jgi:membrane-associated phospholipid phosphatase
VWVGLGSVLAFLLPAAGPCFYPQLVGSNPDFQQLLNRLSAIQSASGTPLLALHNQQVLWHAHTHDNLAFGGGISAMPSVHNGLAVLFALAAWRIKPVLGIAFGAYAALIWIGSIHLGWHYAVDGIVAGLLTYWIWRACGKLADRLERPLFQKSVEPALA